MNALDSALRQKGAIPAPVDGAVARALSINTATRDAATQQMAADPLQQKLAAEQAKTDAAKAAAAVDVGANSKLIQEIAAEPLPEKPTVPRLKPLPAPPDTSPQGPLKTMGKYLPVLLAVGAGALMKPGMAAMQSATAMLNGIADNREAEIKQAQDDWLMNMKLTLAENEQTSNQYKMAMDDRSATMAEKLSRIQTLAAASQDRIMLATLGSGNVDGVQKLIETRDAAASQLAQTVQHVDQVILQQQQLAESARHNRASEGLQGAGLAIERAREARLQAEAMRKGKDVPTAFQKIEAPIIDQIQKADSVNLTLQKNLQRLKDKTLKLGVIDNLISRGRVAVGQADASAANYAEFLADIEGMRNEILMMHKGTQTEGDAKRAMSAIIQSKNDPRVVMQQFQKLQVANNRLIQMQTARVQGAREANGYAPYDVKSILPSTYATPTTAAPTANATGAGWTVKAVRGN